MRRSKADKRSVLWSRIRAAVGSAVVAAVISFVALIALAILIGCFTPEPITINF